MSTSLNIAGHPENLKIVLIDDDSLSSHNLAVQLTFVGETPVAAASDSWADAVTAVRREGELLALVLGCISKISLSGLLQDIHQSLPELPLICIRQDENDAVGQLDPVLRKRLLIIEAGELEYRSFSAALRKARALRGFGPRQLQSRLINEHGTALFRSLAGESRVIHYVRQQIRRVAERDVTVLVSGESGAGKEVVARNLHYHSGRGEAPFIAVNCATIATDQNGIELFGRSSESGTVAAGLIELADGGTLYLDEISELPLNIQGLLLRFLEDKLYHHNGSGELKHADVRIVAGASVALAQRVRQGRFRAELFYRLNLMPIEVPSLRDRLEDIPALLGQLGRSLESKGYEIVSLNSSAVEALRQHDWPGNVRELANLVERLCIMLPGEVIGIEDLPLEYRHRKSSELLPEEIEALTGDYHDYPLRPMPDSEPEAQENTVSDPDTGQPMSPSAAAGEYRTEDESTGSAEAGEQAVAETEDAVSGLSQEPAEAAVNQYEVETSVELPAAGVVLDESRLREYLRRLEKQLLLTALEDCGNIPGFAAERLHISEPQLQSRLQAFGLQP